MNICRQEKYDDWSDKELVAAVIAIPHNEEAGFYLICVRYSPLLKSIYHDLRLNWSWYEDCVSELLIYLRGKEGSWKYLAGFEWRCSLATWLRCVAKRQFSKTYSSLIENGEDIISIDEEGDGVVSIIETLPIEEDGLLGEKAMRRVLMMEAIMQMDNEDEKFIILKYLKGYSGEENAEMLRERWQSLNVVRYKNGKKVIPSRPYINMEVGRIKSELRETVNEMLKCKC